MRLLLLTLFTFSALTLFSQNPTARPRTDDPASVVRTYLETADTAIERRLVDLTLAGPTYDGSNHTNRINELELRRAKTSWLNLLVISTSYYDQSANKQVGGNTAYVYPKYYFSLSIPLGIIFSQGNLVKTARESVALGKDRQEELSRSLKADVVGRYKQYKNFSMLINMQAEMINDVMTSSSQIEDNFKKGQVTVEAYIGAQRTKNEELAKLMSLKLQQDLLKLDIEKMIGIPLEQVTRVPLPGKNFR